MTPPPAQTCDGRGLKRAVEVATAALERQAAVVNALNVFPVPDGDTGTNMLLTLRSSLAEAAGSTESAGALAAQLARGGLMGARGNSGVILSQIVRGFARALEGRETFGPRELAAGFALAAQAAYEAVSRPVEGTMLTVAREMARAACAAADADGDIVGVLAAATATGRAAVANTPNQLAILREAGVVDAGGQGLLVLVEAVLRFARGESVEIPLQEPATVLDIQALPSLHAHVEAGGVYGYCTEFVVQATTEAIDLAALRAGIEAIGDSTLVVGDQRVARVHLHTFDPGRALTYAVGLGTLHRIKIENMQEQYERFRQEEPAMPGAGRRPDRGVAVVAVAAGPGLTRVLQSLGAAAIVGGGQAANPSAEELLRAIEAVPAAEVIILPNNKNVVLAAQQAIGLAEKRACVVPSQNVPQGIAALLALRAEAGMEENCTAMTEAMAAVQVAEVTSAVRAAQMNGLTVAAGETIGLINGQLVTAGPDATSVVLDLLARLGADRRELITIYTGEGVGHPGADDLRDRVRHCFPGPTVELVDGGQPHYPFILSVE
ncbi:MAG: DAK2 domain-containing protein [Chloroflexi bacterium]|nr:DAK2 domain-containing protein [Chloroflexota bacterium]